MKSSATPSTNSLAARLLDAGRTAAPVRYHVDRGLSRHRELVRHGIPAADWAGPGARAGTKSFLKTTAGKAMLGSALAAVIAASAWAYTEAGRSSRPPDVPASPPSLHGASLRASPPPEQHAVAPHNEPKPAHSGPVTPLDSLERVPEHERVVTPPAAVDARRRPWDEPGAPTHSEAPRPEQAERSAPVQLKETSSATEAPVTPAQPPRPSPSSAEISEEVAQVAAAERLLESSPARALALARAGDARFPKGFLRQDRRYIEVMALFRMGSTDQAERAARHFLSVYPSGPYAARVRARLAEAQ